MKLTVNIITQVNYHFPIQIMLKKSQKFVKSGYTQLPTSKLLPVPMNKIILAENFQEMREPKSREYKTHEAIATQQLLKLGSEFMPKLNMQNQGLPSKNFWLYAENSDILHPRTEGNIVEKKPNYNF